MSGWTAYYQWASGDPRETLLDAASRFEAPGSAVDLGCGAGRDTFELLRRGWRVLAVDAEEEAIARLRAAAPPGDLETLVAPFDAAEWPPADLVNSSFALPFTQPAAFAAVWARVVASLRPGGRFSGQLFGVRDGWARNPNLTFHDAAQARALFDGLELERFDEEEREGTLVTGEAKRWHVFHVVARKPR